MISTFVPKDFITPLQLRDNNFYFKPLNPSVLKKDYEAIKSSLKNLQKTPTPPLCGFWPKDNLTIEEDLIDLKWHDEMHKKNIVFAYTVLTYDKSQCIGCIYFFPSEQETEVDIYFWLTDNAIKMGLERKFFNVIKKWLSDQWPFKKVAFPGRTHPYINSTQNLDLLIKKLG